ncbi:MAG: T9SS type A sorting domain-containing protein, partial [Bacteroidetes bacterium]|nr:T9SS type A sorting domain-containing protein [Bacteroidota bacterium]
VVANYFSSAYNTTAHELGHAFYLYHTFNGDGGNVSCPVNNACSSDGDKVCDTPPHKQGDCGTTDVCTGTGIWANSKNNQMSYCGTRYIFTADQKARVTAAANSAPRSSLLTSNGCTPVLMTATSNSPRCIGTTLNLYGSGGVTYSWSGPNGFTSALQNPAISNVTLATAGVYTVTITNSLNTTSTLTTSVTVITSSASATASSSSPGCIGAPVNLFASAGDSYSWAGPNGFTSALQNPTINNASSLAAGTYTVTVNSAGCTSTATTGIVMNASPAAGISAGGPTTFCPGNSVVLTSNPSNLYSWSSGATTQSITATLSGTYTVTVTNSFGCTASSAVGVTRLPAMSLVVTPTDASCGLSNGSASVAVSGGTSLQTTTIPEDWESTNSWTLVNGSETNKWFVGTATANGGTRSIYISNNSNVNAYTVNSSAAVHFYKDFVLPASAKNITVKFDWKGMGQNGQDYFNVFLVPVTTTPTAGNTLSAGQIGSASYNQQNNYTTATISGLDANAGTTKRLVFSWQNNQAKGTQPPASIDNISVSYDASGTYSYNWSTSPVQSSQIAGNLSAGTYTVTVTDVKSCTSTSSVSISQQSTFSINITASGPTTFCQGDSVKLTSSAANSYLWSNGKTTQSITVTASGTYSVQGTNTCGNASAQTTVTVIPKPTPAITGGMIICNGNNTTLTVSGGTSYLWNTGETTSSIIVSPPITTTYSVNVTDNGCAGTTLAAITVNPLPVTPTITANGSTLTSSSATGNQWYMNGFPIPGATSQTYIAVVAGDYTVEVTDVNGCSDVSASYTLATVGVKMISEKSMFQIQPNPNNGIFIISAAGNSAVEKIRIYNMLGKVVYLLDRNIGITTNVDLSDEPSGVYFIELLTGGKVCYKKLIKE